MLAQFVQCVDHTQHILLSMLMLSGLKAYPEEILKICAPEIEYGSSFDGKL